MPFPPQRETAALEAQRLHRLSIEWLPDGRYRATTGTGPARSSIGTETYPDPVEAIEGAVAQIQAGAQRSAEQHRGRLFDALTRAIYMPWPETPPGKPLRWLILRTSDRQQTGLPHDGLMSALLEIARLVDEPTPPVPEP